MNSTAKRYWSYARECELWAASLTDERDRAIFCEMQEAWAALALQSQSAFRTARPSLTNTVARGEGNNQTEQPPAFPRRRGRKVLRLVGVFLAGMTTGTFLLSYANRQIAETAFDEAKTALTFLSNAPLTHPDSSAPHLHH